MADTTFELSTILTKSNDYEANDDYLDGLTDDEYTDFVAEFLKPTPIEWVFVTAFFILMLVGIMGNCLVVYVVLRNKSMWSPMNLFLCNLAFSDLLVLLFCLPPTVLNDVTKTFWLSAGFCKAMVFCQNTSVYVSVFTLMCISFERWRAISQPLVTRFWHTRRIILIVWAVAGALSLPEPLTLTIYPAEYARKNFSTIWGTRCKESWSMGFQQNYQMAQTVFLFIVPLFIITALCIHMSLILREKSLQIGKRQLKERQKAIKILVAVVLVFAISYLPVHLHNIATSYSSSVINPIAYNFISERFRKEFHRACHCLGPSTSRSDSYRERFYSIGRLRPSMATCYSPTPLFSRASAAFDSNKPPTKKVTLVSMGSVQAKNVVEWALTELADESKTNGVSCTIITTNYNGGNRCCTNEYEEEGDVKRKTTMMSTKTNETSSLANRNDGEKEEEFARPFRLMRRELTA